MNLSEIEPFLKRQPKQDEALRLVHCRDLRSLCKIASQLRDQHHGWVISYSKKSIYTFDQTM
jgi:hypothetical protein